MNLPILPYEGVGPIRLGMSQGEAREVMACEFKSFKRTPDSEMPLDEFLDWGIYVNYRMPGICEAIEICSPANPTWRKYRLLGIPFDQLVDYFRREDPAVEVDGDGLTSRLFGIGLYVHEGMTRRGRWWIR